MKPISYLGAILVAAYSSTPSAATVFSDRSAFLAAVDPSPAVITFTGLVGTPGYPEYVPSGFAATPGYTLEGVNFSGVAPYFYAYIFDPIQEDSLAGSASGLFDQFGGVFTLNSTATAFGFDYGSRTGVGNLSINVNLVDGSSVSNPLSFTSNGFFGYTGYGAIASVVVDDPSNSAYYFKYDNVTLGNTLGNPPGGVPEPASWAMLIAGFGLVGAVARRRRGCSATTAA